MVNTPGSQSYVDHRANMCCFGGFAITPSDTVNMLMPTKRIYVGGNGNIAAVMQSGDVLVFTSCLVGTFLDICAVRINNTSTTATNLIGLI